LFAGLSYSQVCVGTQGQVTWQCWQDLYDNEMGELMAREDYPLDPDYELTLYKIQSPINFDNMMGAKISGFLSVPVSDTVTFNITGDDFVRFYLSSDSDPDNMALEAYTDNWTNVEEHNKYPEQTSAPIYLSAGTYYYFELMYIEGSGGDHVSLWWMTDNEDPNDWTLVNANYIHSVDCLPANCPERGTSCDDSDPTTVDDQEDGFCNCIGQPNTSNNCIGDRFSINAYMYDSIPGGELNDLYTEPDFPAMPFTSSKLDYLALANQNNIDSSGTLIQAFLSVPVTGNYKFNITGNNECIFFLSSDEDPANKQAHQILVTNATDPTEHDKYIYQSTSNISLDKGKYYYIELNHKEGSWNEHYGIFWQTPFTEEGTWKRIPDFYLYDYDCGLACIPQGTPCDDGDPFTNNDIYNADCDCAGTPCSGPDCDDPLASYTPYPKCDLTDQIDNRADNNWLSCNISANPNSTRPNGHWIQYDFGQKFLMYSSHIWNYNEDGNFDQGFENVAIDYSLDGTNWTELIVQSWPLADGSSEYAGFSGPDFGGIEARYVLITCLDDPASPPCRGFSKLLINAEYCPTAGEACDDGNPNTIYDTYSDDCVCAGVPNLFNDCLVDTLTLGDTLIVMDTLSARTLLSSSNTIGGNDMVMFVSGEEIDLEEGFETVAGSNFEAFIEVCNTPPSNGEEDTPDNPVAKSKIDPDYLKISHIPDTDIYRIDFYVESAGQVRLDIANSAGQNLFSIIDVEFINKGMYAKRFRSKKMDQGVYNIVYRQKSKKYLEKFTVSE